MLVETITTKIKVGKLKRRFIRKLLPSLKKKKTKNKNSYFLYVRFENASLRGGVAHTKVVETFGTYFSAKIEPVLLALPGEDISNTPKGRFDAEVEKATFVVDIHSEEKFSFTYPVAQLVNG